MNKALPLLAGAAAFCLYGAWTVWTPVTQSFGGQSVPVPLEDKVASFAGGDAVWLAASYALSAAFTVFAVMMLRQNRRRAVAAAAGGLAMTGVVYTVACGAGCFALGCCGSPMLPVWVGLFGAKWAQASGPAIFGITLASLALGFWLFWKKSARGCATTCGDRCEG